MENKIRRYDIDWLRVIAFYFLIFYHVGMFFVPWDFHLKNPTTTEWFETWMAFMSQWRLPLLFFISGIVVYHSLGKRTGGKFLLERTKRLFIPLLFGMLVIVPPQIYFERIYKGIQFANYWEFWKTIFNFVPYPMGGSLSWHHLWYVLYIFSYSIIALPLFLFFRSDKSLLLKNKIAGFVKKYPNAIYLISLPLMIFHFALVEKFPVTHSFFDDWYYHSIAFTIFIFGFIISSVDGLLNVIVVKRKQSLVMAGLPSIFLILFVWGPTFEIFNDRAPEFVIIYRILKWILIPSILYTFLGYGKIFLNQPSKILSYASESVYPLYILHQTVMIAFGYYIIQWSWGIVSKFILLVILTFGGSLLIYEIVIKRFNITRFLFGMKTLNQKKLKMNLETEIDSLEIETNKIYNQ